MQNICHDLYGPGCERDDYNERQRMFVVSLKALMNSVATLMRYPELAIRALRYRPLGIGP
ncbi:hypothetical protein AN948_03430 [Rhodococcus sp. ADH]|nr:hypothetical protein AN948_03430 [Rhodococcus sp. ADH]